MSEEQDKKQKVEEEPSKEDLTDEELSGLDGGMSFNDVKDGLSKTICIAEDTPKLME